MRPNSLAEPSGVVVLLAMVFIAQTANAQSVDRIVEHWKARHRALAGVQYYAEGKAGVSRGAWTETFAGTGMADPNEIIPSQDFIADVALEIALDIQQGRGAKHSTQVIYNLNRKRIEVTKYINLHNGREFQILYPRDDNSRLRAPLQRYAPEIRKADPDSGSFFDPNDRPILMSVGVMPLPKLDTRPQDISNPAFPSDLKVVATVPLDGREHVVLRSAPFGNGDTFYEYWVDASRQAAVSRFIYVIKGRPWLQCDTEHTFQDGHWLVERWKTAWFQGDDVEMWREMTVTKRVVNPNFSDGDFHVVPKEGLIVQDDVTGRVVVKGATPDEDEDIRTVMARERGQNTWIVTAVILIAGLVLFCTIAIRLRYRSSEVS